MPRAIAQFCHDVSFANLNQKEVSSVTIISRGGARRPPREAATVSSAPQGRWLGKCATSVADGLPLDDVASAVEADSSIISSVAKGLPALGELDPCADELGLAILEISTITMTHLAEWMTHHPRDRAVSNNTIVKMLPRPGAAVILAGPRRLSAVDYTAR